MVDGFGREGLPMTIHVNYNLDRRIHRFVLEIGHHLKLAILVLMMLVTTCEQESQPFNITACTIPANGFLHTNMRLRQGKLKERNGGDGEESSLHDEKRSSECSELFGSDGPMTV